MGKSRRNRAASRRSDPISQQNKPPKPPSDPELVALRSERILPVLKDLQSVEAKSRTAAAGAIANIIQDSKCRKLLLREQVVHIVLSETLTDSSLESKAAGWEILKVLVQNEEPDFSVHLYRSDVLTAANFAAKQILEILESTEKPFLKNTPAYQRFVWEISTSLVSLLDALGEAQDYISAAIAKDESITRLLCFLVRSDLTPGDFQEGVLSCLITISEDNRDLSQRIVDPHSTSCYGKLLNLKESTGALAVLACALLHNIFTALEWHDQSQGPEGACDAILVPSLARAIQQVTSPAGNLADVNCQQMLQLVFDVLASIGTLLQVSLEKGNRDAEVWNGFQDDDEMLEDAEVDDSEPHDATNGVDTDHEMRGDDGKNESNVPDLEEESLDLDMDIVTGRHDTEAATTGLDDIPTLRELIDKALPQLILRAQSRSSNDHLGALSALNNIAWTVSLIEFADGANDSILRAWTVAAERIWVQVITPVLAQDTSDLKLATLVASLAWALSRVLGGKAPAKEGEPGRFISLYKVAGDQVEDTEDPFQSLGVKCIGVLGQLARHPATLTVNREIGVFLVTLLEGLPTVPLAHAVEALDQLFDIYGDEDLACDAVFWKDDFLSHLESILPKAKSAAKLVDKRKNMELRTRADEAVLNLGRFIQYKRKHKR